MKLSERERGGEGGEEEKTIIQLDYCDDMQCGNEVNRKLLDGIVWMEIIISKCDSTHACIRRSVCSSLKDVLRPWCMCNKNDLNTLRIFAAESRVDLWIRVTIFKQRKQNSLCVCVEQMYEHWMVFCFLFNQTNLLFIWINFRFFLKIGFRYSNEPATICPLYGKKNICTATHLNIYTVKPCALKISQSN